jgi:hypothetical protein
MYCGVDVVVRDAIQLAAGRVKESTSATAITKPLGASSCSVVLLTFGGLLLICAFVALRDLELGIALLFVGIALACIVPSFMRLARRHETKEIGIEGACPYCGSHVRAFHILGVKNPGTDCDACKRRIVISENRFFSVDTPVSRVQP